MFAGQNGKCNKNSAQTCLKTPFTNQQQMFYWKSNLVNAINKSSNTIKYETSV